MLKSGKDHLAGKDHLEGLRDGRAVYIGGERVEDVTSHPAFRNAARTVAALYDLKRQPARREILSYDEGGEARGSTRRAADGPVASSRGGRVGHACALFIPRKRYSQIPPPLLYGASARRSAGFTLRAHSSVGRAADS